MTNTPINSPNGSGKPPWYRQRGKVISLIAVVLVAAGAIALVAWNELKRPDDVSNPDVPFVKTKPKQVVPKDRTINWSTFRLNPQRTGYLPVNGIHPPFKRVWKYGDQPLLEFPPIVVDGRLYFVDNDGNARALRADNGREIWHRKIADLNASTPTYARGRLYIVNLEPGHVLSMNAKNGRIIWEKPLPCRSESSPAVIRQRVYFGCENGVLYALKARNGKEVWETSVDGAIKGAPAYEDGTLFVGDYGGVVSAVRAKTGEIKWQSDSLGGSFGRAGSFYSTPAVAYGRVYLGSNDGRVYSFDKNTGELAWTYSTGDWVYSGPSVAQVPGTPPTVYIGSFDGNVYALNARSGEARWTFPMGGQVIGSLSVIGRTVYAATFDGTTTYGISAKSGRKVFEFHTGAYMPGISDGEKLYLVGYSSIHAMKPITLKQLRAERRAKEARKAARQKARKQAAQNQAGPSGQ
ncbi:MAG TPA: PQQ-binding-like beta-propeller repeat protein [Solirubrobacterales bacterium]|jgi:outer membrane protein assembly factor BamB|nr:PQQ-binding-like beta-propeller repeat protein [Solirubrobacterales bacterium]HMW44416.1 PQQ-binding-like beta-propeller repeat protein [Solirubrobacterales bacterium]HMX70627.1 PQQ-binding-like beta-propeller repeat protein [Solirubrobacterales bacterium]HMY26469.1 PQQ-binding-like beta-propeller repeat protein [Solirubrobacterales bacterium]HNA22862.1 PQQ-binding-like beta-propeller repeat protein [Solirubrobacterales bacterium]